MQIANDRCMTSILDNMQKNPAVKGLWKRFLFNSWLRARKAKAMLAKCDKIRTLVGRIDWDPSIPRSPERVVELHWQLASDNFRENEEGELEEVPLERPENGFRWEQFAQDRETAQGMVNFCMDEKRHQALNMSQAYFMQTVPLINSTSFQDVLNENQNLVLSNATGEPLTDDELLNMDLSKPENMPGYIRVEPGLFGDLDQALAETRNERERQANELEKTLAGNNSNLDIAPEWQREAYRNATPGSRLHDKHKEYLYHQGMVHKALEARGQLREDFQGNLTDLTAPAVCLMSGYETSIKGEALNFVLTGIMGGGIASVALRASAAIAGRGMTAFRFLRTGERVRTPSVSAAVNSAPAWSVGGAISAGFTEMAGRDVGGGCFFAHNDRGMPAISAPETPDMIRTGANLPDDVGPAPQVIPQQAPPGQPPWDPDIQEQMDAINQVIKTPQCGGQYSYLRQHIERISCAQAVLTNLPGMKLGPGAMIEGAFMAF